MGGVEYQVTKVDPTDPETKGMVYQVHKVSEEVAATLGGKVYRARIIKDPTDPTVAGKVYQIVLIGDPSDPAVKGKVYNAILTGGSEAVVVGPAVSPLALDDAVAGPLSYVKAFGGTEQNGTPTPTVPVDIISNNGALKAIRPSGLPAGYTALEYIESTGTQYIDLGVKGNGNNKVDVTFRYHTASGATGAGRVFGSRQTSSSNAFAIGSSSGAASTTGNKVFWCYDAQAFYVVDVTFDLGEWQNVIFSATEHKLNGTSYGDDYNVVEFETPQNLKLFGFDNGGTMGYGRADIAQCKLWDNGVLIRDLVPAKNASGVIGMYDKVNDAFYTNADEGTGDFVAGPNAVDPITIVTDGTVETIGVYGDNLIDLSAVTDGYYYDPQGNYTALSAARLTDYIPIEAGKDVKIYFKSLSTTSNLNVRINIFNSSKVWQSQEVLSLEPLADGTKTITPTNNGYIRVSGNYSGGAIVDWNTASITESSGSVTAEMLLSVGDYTDEQEIISGAVTRKVGIKVLDGTESWGSSVANKYYLDNDYMRNYNNTPVLCTHYEGILAAGTSGVGFGQVGLFASGSQGISSARLVIGDNSVASRDAFKEYLANKYAAGDPVIVIYPLKTETTETVTGQPLQTTDGDNTLEIIQASIDDLELEAEYEKEAD